MSATNSASPPAEHEAPRLPRAVSGLPPQQFRVGRDHAWPGHRDRGADYEPSHARRRGVSKNRVSNGRTSSRVGQRRRGHEEGQHSPRSRCCASHQPTPRVPESVRAQAVSSEDLARRRIERRAVEAVIWGMPAVNYDLMYQAMIAAHGKYNQIVYWSRLPDWKNQTLTPNPDSIYLMPFFNTKDVGPMVLEIPPADEGSITGSIDDAWQAALEDVGPAGVDKGKDGKYLILPPGYKAKPPNGYIALPSTTYQAMRCCARFSKAVATRISPRPSHTRSGSSSIRCRRPRTRRRPLSSMRSTSCSTARFPTTCAFFSRSTAWCRPNRGSSATRDDRHAQVDRHREGQAVQSRCEDAGDIERRRARSTCLARHATKASSPAFYEGSHWALPASPDCLEGLHDDFADPDAYPVDGRGSPSRWLSSAPSIWAPASSIS